MGRGDDRVGESKMKVLIVEASSHTKGLEHIYHLLRNKCSLTFYFNNFLDQKYNLLSLFPSVSQTHVIKNRFHHGTFFIWILFYGGKYDYIYISTGPEGNHSSEILNIIFFYVCCLFYREKIILSVKNIRSYLRSTPGLFSFLRSKSIKYLRRFTFETETQRDCFSKNANTDEPFLGISYNWYPDLLDSKFEYDSDRYPRDSVRVGLLGTINSERRDYNIIIDALKKMTVDERMSLTLVTLGGNIGESSQEVIDDLSDYVKVDCHKGMFLSAHEFDVRGTSCDLLISTLQKKGEYGKFKGSGSFGDAVYLRKKIILPTYVDENKEFNEISVYYKDLGELLAIFKNIKELSKEKVSLEFIEKFTTENVFTNLVKDLKLCSLS